MLEHKGGKINNALLIAGVGNAEMSHLQNCSIKIFIGRLQLKKKDLMNKNELKNK